MPTTVQIRNKHGCLAPDGCKLPRDRTHPQVAVGDEVAGPYEATFLIERGDLEPNLLDMVKQSWTLKAWFAYKIRVKGLKDRCGVEAKLPSWERVWILLRRKAESWASVYEDRKRTGTHTTQWEIGEPKSALDLFVLTLAVLSVKIEETSQPIPGVPRLMWHHYYYESEGKFFALYHFMLYQHKLFGPNRSDSIYPPSGPSIGPYSYGRWVQSCGYKIREAAEDFVKGRYVSISNPPNMN